MAQRVPTNSLQGTGGFLYLAPFALLASSTESIMPKYYEVRSLCFRARRRREAKGEVPSPMQVGFVCATPLLITANRRLTRPHWLLASLRDCRNAERCCSLPRRAEAAVPSVNMMLPYVTAAVVPCALLPRSACVGMLRAVMGAETRPRLRRQQPPTNGLSPSWKSPASAGGATTQA